MKSIRYLLICIAFFGSPDAFSVEIVDARVEKKGDRYHVFGSSLVQASPEFIYATLMDFDNFHKIAGGIKETRFVQSESPDEILGYTRIESCVLFFCRGADKLERIEAVPYSEIRTEAIPEKSDFIVNNSRWTMERRGCVLPCVGRRVERQLLLHGSGRGVHHRGLGGLHGIDGRRRT